MKNSAPVTPVTQEPGEEGHSRGLEPSVCPGDIGQGGQAGGGHSKEDSTDQGG